MSLVSEWRIRRRPAPAGHRREECAALARRSPHTSLTWENTVRRAGGGRSSDGSSSLRLLEAYPGAMVCVPPGPSCRRKGGKSRITTPGVLDSCQEHGFPRAARHGFPRGGPLWIRPGGPGILPDREGSGAAQGEGEGAHRPGRRCRRRMATSPTATTRTRSSTSTRPRRKGPPPWWSSSTEAAG